MKLFTASALALASLALTSLPSRADFVTTAAPMLSGSTPATSGDWQALPVFTVGESIDGYTPPGILDGIGALPVRDPKKPADPKKVKSVRVLVNHEFGNNAGTTYTLANGTPLTGARLSELIFDAKKLTVASSQLAFDAVRDRGGFPVVMAAQINQIGDPLRGFSRFCSGRSVARGHLGFVDDVYFAGEENSQSGSYPHGGTVWALDVDDRTLWGVPALGRGAWENVSPIQPASDDSIAIVMQDDTAPSPLYLYRGQKDALGNGSFLDRNGLAVGQIFAWVSDAGHVNPSTFNGPGAFSAGHFVLLTSYDAGQAGNPGYDSAGWANQNTLRAQAALLGAFQFSRPEDVHENPADPSQAFLASTGRDTLFGGADSWGTLYVVDFDVANLPFPTANVTIVHDADALPDPDAGVRSPDNVTWSPDGYAYAQKDRSISGFGLSTGAEASLWQVDPVSGATLRIGEIDRSAVPAGQSDPVPGDIGNWESSGVLDVSDLFKIKKHETLLLLDVQAHSLTDGTIAAGGLVEGGQLLFFTNDLKRKQPKP